MDDSLKTKGPDQSSENNRDTSKNHFPASLFQSDMPYAYRNSSAQSDFQ